MGNKRIWGAGTFGGCVRCLLVMVAIGGTGAPAALPFDRAAAVLPAADAPVKPQRRSGEPRTDPGPPVKRLPPPPAAPPAPAPPPKAPEWLEQQDRDRAGERDRRLDREREWGVRF